jgi:transcriptional regulator with XRE-family HTH domain
MPFGNRLKDARIRKGMTQEELARAVGVTKGAIGNYESELSSPKEVILIKLMKILNIDANYLYQDMVASTPVSLSVQEQRLLSAYRNASPKYQELALELLEEHPAKSTAQSAG